MGEWDRLSIFHSFIHLFSALSKMRKQCNLGLYGFVFQLVNESVLVGNQTTDRQDVMRLVID